MGGYEEVLARVPRGQFIGGRFVDTGAVLPVRDPATGEVLAAANSPSSGFDRALTGRYPPGSTFKPIVGLAAMKRGLDPSRRIFCNGSFYLGRRFACLGRHGALDLRGAIKASCNVYFMTLATEMGPDAIAETARDMGFGQTFDIGIPGQKAGLVPDREWRRKNPVRGDGKWYPGENPSYGIGQGALTVNALQLAV